MEKLRERLHEALTKNKIFLLDNSLGLLEDSKTNSAYKKVFYNVEWENKEDLKTVLTQTLMFEKSPSFVRDEIYFDLKPMCIIDNQKELVDTIDKIFKRYEFKCEEEYWEVEENISRFQKMPSFDCFEDVIIPAKDVHKYTISRIVLYNVNDWLNFFEKATAFLYNDFPFDKKLSTSKTLRFSKIINEKYKLIIEYDRHYLKKRLREGSLDEPTYRLLLVNSSYNKQADDYLYKIHPDVIYFQELEHPVFRGTFGTGGIFARLNSFYDGTAYAERYPTQYTKLYNGEVRLSNDIELGKRLIKYAFYSLDFKCFFSKPYFEYIEKSIFDSLD